MDLDTLNMAQSLYIISMVYFEQISVYGTLAMLGKASHVMSTTA